MAEKTIRSAADAAEELRAMGHQLGEMRARPADQRSDNWTDELKTTLLDIRALDTEFNVLSELEAYDRDQKQSESRGPKNGHATDGGYRSAGLDVIESDGYAERRDGKFEVELRTLLTSAEDDGVAAGLFIPRGSPIFGQPRQMRLFVRDVIPFTPTNLNSIPYIRELTPATTEVGASAVGEASAKPEVAALFSEQDAAVRKIAAWIPITNEVLEDAPTLRGYIDGRLRYMLAVREEQQILHGSGTAPQLRGILETSGLQTRTTGGTTTAERVGLAIGDVEAVDGAPDAIVMRPEDFWESVTTRSANQFDGGAVGVGLPYAAAPTTLWGLPVIRSRALAANQCVVGSFGIGAQGFDRRQAYVKSTDSHDDYFIYNKTVLLAEERLALAVHRPDFFVEVTLP